MDRKGTKEESMKEIWHETGKQKKERGEGLRHKRNNSCLISKSL
jgi:hypothetical protein